MKIYVDTSVFGGCFDEKWQEYSNPLIQEFICGKKRAVISDLTLRELLNAPEQVKNIIDQIPDEYKEFIPFDDEAEKLANKYIEEQAITQKSLLDAQHIAIATVNKIDVLVSWNFKHIVNLQRIRLYNSVNLKYGYSFLEIRSPIEVIEQ
jgi:predicted nucleic acid-binding protein